MMHLPPEPTNLVGVRFNYPPDGQAIAELAECVYNPAVDPIIASVSADGELKGAVLYNQWTGYDGSIVMHAAGVVPHWLSRQFLFYIFDYPFNQLKVRQVFAQVKASNRRSLRLCRHVGFDYLHRILDVYPNDDMMLLNMRREACRYLRHGG